MAIREILKYPNPILRKKSIDVDISDISTSFLHLINDIEDTLEIVDTGAALSAVQVGILQRFFITNQSLITSLPAVIINPIILNKDGKQLMMREGCLSFPGITLNVLRWSDITVDYSTIINGSVINRKQKYSGFEAQMFQHEIDHFDGKLFVDSLKYSQKINIVKNLGAKQWK